jgi:UDP-glucuronate 4-epimerase
MHVALRLLREGHSVVGIDNLNTYYNPALKKARLAELKKNKSFSFHKLDLANSKAMEKLFKEGRFSRVVHLAAQAGVRYSLQNPHQYTESNVSGFLNVLEGCRHHAVEHLVFASSSSVYGLNTTMPWSVGDNVDHPISLYAATKKANELMAHAYSHLFGIPTTGLRFFTVYGPWGRPDMAVFLFTKAILCGQSIDLFNNGKMRRDFTYVDDVVEGVARVLAQPAKPNPAWNGARPDPATSSAPYRLYNIGNQNPVELGEFVAALESVLGRKAKINYKPLQAGDVIATAADVKTLEQAVGYRPSTPLKIGLEKFAQWFQDNEKLCMKC